MSIIVTRQINEITVNVTRNGLSTIIQPVISKNKDNIDGGTP